MKGSEYYAERLLSQAISDPRVNALDGEAVEAYIKEEAEKLCLDPEEVAAHAMRGYEAVTTGDFKAGTEYPHYPTVSREGKGLSGSPPF